MVGLHMLHDQIVGRALAERGTYLSQPFVGKTSVNSVQYGNLLVNDHVGIVAHSVWNTVLTFEQINVGIIDTNIKNVIKYLHFCSFLCYLVVAFITGENADDIFCGCFCNVCESFLGEECLVRGDDDVRHGNQAR